MGRDGARQLVVSRLGDMSEEGVVLPGQHPENSHKTSKQTDWKSVRPVVLLLPPVTDTQSSWGFSTHYFSSLLKKKFQAVIARPVEHKT